jgi:hypothetical protein
MSAPLTPRERKLKRRLRRIERAIVYSGGVAKVKMEVGRDAAGRPIFAYGVFLPYQEPPPPRVLDRRTMMPLRTSRQALSDLDLARGRRVRSSVRSG